MARVRLGVIGFGFRGGEVARAMRGFPHMFDVAAACDLDPQRLEVARQMGIATTCTDYRRLLDDQAIDAVYVCTPQTDHCRIVLDAFAHGKHVYCEKPMSLRLDECDRMIAAARDARRTLLVGLQMRYHAHLQKIARLIAEGAIGRPAMIWLDEYRNPFPATMRWAFDKSRSGGTLVEKSCHHFDIFNWFAGSRPVRVLSSGGAMVHKEIFGIASEVADHAVVTVEYESGCKASYKLCMFAGAPDEREYGIGYHHRDIGVMGTSGMVRTEGFDLGQSRIEQRFADSRNRVVHEIATQGQILTPYNQNGNTGIFYELYECITQNRPAFTDGQVGRASLAVSLAAEQSLERGTWVDVLT